MGKQELDVAVGTLIDALRTQLAAAELIMTTVSTNTITAPQVTNLNAAIAALRAAMVAANAPLRAGWG